MTDQNAIARAHMVDSQVRPNQVNDRRVIAAMRALPREDFVPPGRLAYTDSDIPLGGGRFMLAPLTIARLAQLVLAEHPVHVLVVGAGSGYGAALLSQCGAAVVALEDETVPVSPALARHAPELVCVSGRLTAGWPAGGPYDAILIEGAIAEVPPAFAAQLAPGGRVVTILHERAGGQNLGRAVIAVPSGAGFAVARMFDCTARLLPAFQPAPAFSF